MLACAASGRWTHPVIAVWPVAIRHDLRRAVGEQGIRKIDRFTQPYGCAAVHWPTVPVDPFFNVNTPEDLAEADGLVALHPDL
jgi:molybdopterin-guanine dinucleotide biosynthesis protein A